MMLMSCLLVACQQVDDVNTTLYDTIKNFKASDSSKRANHHKELYAYYLPRSVNVIAQDSTYDIFDYKGITLAMSLNAANIIAQAYYPSYQHLDTQIYDENYLVFGYGFVHHGQNYELKLYQVEDSYLLNLNTDFVNFHATMSANYLKDVLTLMLKMADNIVLDEETVVKTLSNRPSIDYEKEQIDLFQIVVPQNGRLEDLIKDHTD